MRIKTFLIFLLKIFFLIERNKAQEILNKLNNEANQDNATGITDKSDPLLTDKEKLNYELNALKSNEKGIVIILFRRRKRYSNNFKR